MPVDDATHDGRGVAHHGRMTLVRIRFQETWGEQLSGTLDDAYMSSEAVGLLPGLAVDWFPRGATVVQDEWSPEVWTATAGDGRVVHFFLEPIGT
jgi:hypothetical protein